MLILTIVIAHNFINTWIHHGYIHHKDLPVHWICCIKQGNFKIRLFSLHSRLRSLHTEFEIIIQNVCMLKNKYDLMLCQITFTHWLAKLSSVIKKKKSGVLTIQSHHTRKPEWWTRNAEWHVTSWSTRSTVWQSAEYKEMEYKDRL